jgi:hypothetical protein
MSKLTRKDQKIFGETAGGESIAVFGSLAANNPAYSTDPDQIQSAEYSGGWESAVIGQASPTMEDRNSLDYLFSRQLSYLYQTGIPAYSATDTYYKGSIVSFYNTEDDALKLYYSIIDDNTGNSLEDTDKWVEWKSGGGASLPILTYQFTDHELNDVSWVKSNFSWLSGSVYLAAYKHLQADVGFRYASSTLTVSHPDFDAGTYVRISALDKTISSTDYYAWGISGTTEDTKCVYTLTTTLADGVKTYFYKNSAMQQLTACIVEAQTETISGTTITYFRAQDGHKIVLDDQATNVASIYSATGVAWYYIFDDTNTQFKLPRSNWNFKGTSNDDVGDFVDESLPNIKSDNTNHFMAYTVETSGYNGALTDTFNASNIVQAGSSGGTGHVLSFDASKSSSIYQDDAHVQEKATKAYLYFYVGNFEQSAIEQTAGINAEDFQQKADTDLGNVNHDGTTLIAHNAMPSETVIPLTWGASGFWYTAPADGYYTATRHSDNSYPANIVGYLYASDGYTFLFGQSMVAPAGSYYAGFTLPMAKGQKAVIFYSNGIADNIQFVYAKGSEPQA